MNKFFTFRQRAYRPREALLFVVVYATGWLFNSLTHDLVFHFSGLKRLAFLGATAVSTCTNFSGRNGLSSDVGRI